MTIQVYSLNKPAAPRRALIATAGLLVLCSMAALSMSRQRVLEARGPMRGGADFGATFRVPPHFEHLKSFANEGSPEFRFASRIGRDVIVLLTVRRLANPHHSSAQEITAAVLQADMGPATRALGVVGATTERIGGTEGVEVFDRGSNTIARGVVRPDGVAYVVSLTVIGARLEKILYRQFDRTCRSFKFES